MFLLAFFFITTISTSLCANPTHERYNRIKKIALTETTTDGSPKRSIENNHEDELSETDYLFIAELQNTHTPDTTPHTPLGSICIEITEYCSYFIEHCMDGPLLSKQREALKVFCNVLKLLTNLADTDCAIIRLDSYITNIVEIIKALEQATDTDNAMAQNRAEYPLIFSLHDQSSQSDETKYIVHSALRAPSSAIPLITELFNELKTYTDHKLEAVLEQFKLDTKTLLTMSQQGEKQTPANNLFSPVEQKNMESLGWLCRHAANTCMDLAQTVNSSALMAHTGALMNQIHQMLATMALTYNHLGTNRVRSQDRNSLATHYATMIEFFKAIPPHRSTLSLITYANTLPSFHERELFISNLFASSHDSTVFLGEFFPAFSDALTHNIDQFCATLTTQVIDTFTKRYWRC